MGMFFKMVVNYQKKIGFAGQLLIEPKPKEPMKHQYDYGERLGGCGWSTNTTMVKGWEGVDEAPIRLW